MACRSRKKRYHDEIAAKIALAKARRMSGSSTRDERKIYRCPWCRGWHLTKKR